MNRLLSILFIAFGLTAHAQFYTATISITNIPAGASSNLTINGTTRYWTNDVNNAPATSIMATNTTAMAATNLVNQLTKYPVSFFALLSQDTPTNVIIKSRTALTISLTAGWGTVTFVTNTTPTEVHFTLPITVHSATNQTNLATWAAESLEFSSTSLKMHWPIMAQVVGLTNNNVLSGTNSLRDGGWTRASITNLTTLSGTLGRTTNGYNTNGVFDSPILTNGVNRGNAFSSPGSGSGSEQFGAGAQATGPSSLAIFGLASGVASIAIGSGSESGGGNDIALGTGSASNATNGVAIGNQANINVSAENGIAIGTGATVSSNDTNSIAIGYQAVTTETNQIMIASASGKVRIPGQLQVTGTQTNTTFTGTNIWQGDIAYARTNNTGLANGNNAGIVINDRTYLKLSGPSAAFTINGIAGGRDGRRILLQNSTTFTLTIANNSGTDPVDANRIYTGTGADVTSTNTPGFVELIYDSATSRWGIISKSN